MRVHLSVRVEVLPRREWLGLFGVEVTLESLNAHSLELHLLLLSLSETL